MKCKNLISGLFLLLLATHALAEKIPTIYLEEGSNEVKISILNNWNKDLADIKFEIDKQKLPTWLNIHKIEQSLNIPKGIRGSEKFKLSFDIFDAPPGAATEIPYTLMDNKGNLWNFALKVYVNSNEESYLPVCDALYENFPNPFNPTTTIRYSLMDERNTKLVIYNSLGQEIRTLVDVLQKPGIYTVQWNGQNDNGQKVSTGLYFYRLTAGSFIKTCKMMFME